jgi:hypothetical protein
LNPAEEVEAVTETEQASGSACPDCHALVADLDAHERWHVRLVTDLAKAVNKDLHPKSASAG